MYKFAVLVGVCSLLLVIPTLTWRNKAIDDSWDDDDDAWLQGDDPAVVEEVDDAPDANIDDNEAGPTNVNGANIVKQRFHYNSIMQLNGRINDSLATSYTYLTIAFYFDRADVALPGFHKFLMEASENERKDATKLMAYINKRGGWFKLRRIVAEERPWTSGLQVLEYMLAHERFMNDNFLYTHKVASESNDGHLTDFLEGEFLEPRVEFIKKLGGYITQLKSFSKDYNLGEYIFDEEL
ncbi:soma ferritin [Patella vulgata]|uniref:soma ferritin n=1 Tax=Patella vulgata TaxID=6465 RepID=UPI0024A7E3FB|nr:soma ferritin [Patella vulgata]